MEEHLPEADQQKMWAPLRFCRICGQDHYAILYRGGNRFEPCRPASKTGTMKTPPRAISTPSSPTCPTSRILIPQEWYTKGVRPENAPCNANRDAVWVAPDGTFSYSAMEGGTPMWWQEGKFWLCLRCGEFYDARMKEYTKLATLSTEGRSSATTILASSLLRLAKQSQVLRPKLLTFTDNRQDASLQAGHFNDFVRTAILRAALYRALVQHRELDLINLAGAVFTHMGLDLSEYAKNPNWDPAGPRAKPCQDAFKKVIEYRLLEDLRRGWRFVQPNLEDVGLLRIEYQGLGDVANRDKNLSAIPALARLNPEERLRILRALLDHFRKRPRHPRQSAEEGCARADEAPVGGAFERVLGN